MTTGQLLTESLAADPVYATCAPAVAYAVQEWREKGYPGATATTQRLLAWWFETDHQVGGRPFAFYPAQRAAIEALIYVYEVARRRDNRALLQAFVPTPEIRLLQHGDFARYGVKMATGSGKTMVMALAVAWSYLNAVREPDCAGYAKSFLIIAPGVIVFERLHGDFAGGAIFRNYPLIPPEYAAEWSEVRFFYARRPGGSRRRRGFVSDQHSAVVRQPGAIPRAETKEYPRPHRRYSGAAGQQ